MRNLVAKSFEQNCEQKKILNDDFGIKNHVPGWVGRGGWTEVKSILRIAYSNQKVSENLILFGLVT